MLIAYRTIEAALGGLVAGGSEVDIPELGFTLRQGGRGAAGDDGDYGSAGEQSDPCHDTPRVVAFARLADVRIRPSCCQLQGDCTQCVAAGRPAAREAIRIRPA